MTETHEQRHTDDSPSVASEQLQVDFKDGLEKAHVSTIVQSNLVLPQVHDQHLRCRKREQCTLALEILFDCSRELGLGYQKTRSVKKYKGVAGSTYLIFTTLTTIGSFHIHDQDLLVLVPAHPNTLCSLLSGRLGHDIKGRSEQPVQQRT